MAEPLQNPQPLTQQAVPKEKKVRVRSIGCLWFFVVLLLAAVGLSGTGVYLLHQEFVRVYGDLDGKVTETSGRLVGLEQGVKAARRERDALSAEVKELKRGQDQLRKEGAAMTQGWQEMKEATRTYQESLRVVLDELRRKKEVAAALEESPSGGKSVTVGATGAKKNE